MALFDNSYNKTYTITSKSLGAIEDVKVLEINSNAGMSDIQIETRDGIIIDIPRHVEVELEGANTDVLVLEEDSPMISNEKLELLNSSSLKAIKINGRELIDDFAFAHIKYIEGDLNVHIKVDWGYEINVSNKFNKLTFYTEGIEKVIFNKSGCNI